MTKTSELPTQLLALILIQSSLLGHLGTESVNIIIVEWSTTRNTIQIQLYQLRMSHAYVPLHEPSHAHVQSHAQVCNVESTQSGCFYTQLHNIIVTSSASYLRSLYQFIQNRPVCTDVQSCYRLDTWQQAIFYIYFLPFLTPAGASYHRQPLLTRTTNALVTTIKLSTTKITSLNYNHRLSAGWLQSAEAVVHMNHRSLVLLFVSPPVDSASLAYVKTWLPGLKGLAPNSHR